MHDELICVSIAAKNLIEFRYDDQVRTAEPYCHGYAKSGKEVLRAFQVSSASGETGWRLFSISKIEGIILTNERFAKARPEYSCEDKAMASVHCCVAEPRD